jgi:hypothetical protein
MTLPTVHVMEPPTIPDDVLAAMRRYEAAVAAEDLVRQETVRAHHALRDLVRRRGIVEPISLVIGTHTVHISPPTILGWGYQIGCCGIPQKPANAPHSRARSVDNQRKGGSSS